MAMVKPLMPPLSRCTRWGQEPARPQRQL